MTNAQKLKHLRQLRRRLREIRELADGRDVSGRYLTTAERRKREEEEHRAAIGGAAGVAAAGGAYAAGRAAVSSLKPNGAKAVKETIKKLPLRARRILSGGALASALRNLR